MKIIFDTLFEMSLTASIVVLAVLLARLFMRRCPKIYSYLLWSVVGVRLCIPISFESRFSIFNLFEKSEPKVYTEVIAQGEAAAVSSSVTGSTVYDPYKLIGIIWLTGVVILTVYGIYTYYRLKYKLRISFPMGNGVYVVEGLSSPFVMGFTEPKIYIPMGLASEVENYVLMHERTHLKRHDHMIKLFAFGLLCIHWFNPFCWLAFILMSRDMEMSCDEKVLGTGNISTDYSSALLSFAQNRHFPSPGPLCFGEVSVKRRIRNILKWKKPALLITLVSVALCVTVFIVCVCDPVEAEKPKATEPKTESVGADTAESSADTTTADTTTVDITTADTTTADTTTIDTTTADTTAAETTPAVTTSAVTTRHTATAKAPVTTQTFETTANKENNAPVGMVIVPETEPVIDDSMQASFEQSLKELQDKMEESMRKDMEQWYEDHPTTETTAYNPYGKPLEGTIVIFPSPGQTPGFNYP